MNNTSLLKIARIIALLCAASGIALLAWDTVKGCACHCELAFILLGIGTILLLLLWINDAVNSDKSKNLQDYYGSEKNSNATNIPNNTSSSSTSYSEKIVEPVAKIVEPIAKIVEPVADVVEPKVVVEEISTSDNVVVETKETKKEYTEEEKGLKINLLSSIVGVATGMDDLKDIVGIGPVYEERLHEIGIKTFEQLTKLTPEAIEVLEDLTGFPGRVEREDWIGQAVAFFNNKKD